MLSAELRKMLKQPLAKRNVPVSFSSLRGLVLIEGNPSTCKTALCKHIVKNRADSVYFDTEYAVRDIPVMRPVYLSDVLAYLSDVTKPFTAVLDSYDGLIPEDNTAGILRRIYNRVRNSGSTLFVTVQVGRYYGKTLVSLPRSDFDHYVKCTFIRTNKDVAGRVIANDYRFAIDGVLSIYGETGFTGFILKE